MATAPRQCFYWIVALQLINLRNFLGRHAFHPQAHIEAPDLRFMRIASHGIHV